MTITRTSDLELDIATLQAIVDQRTDSYNSRVGICHNMLTISVSDFAEDWPEHARKGWCDRTDKYTFIVPHVLGAEDGYLQTPRTAMYSGAYGDARRRLAQHILDKLRTEV